MESKFIKFLKTIGINQDDYETIVGICPGLECVEDSELCKNISLVMEYGYPKEDLDSLILINPGFLMWDNIELENRLIEIVKTYIDLEIALKNDPYLI